MKIGNQRRGKNLAVHTIQMPNHILRGGNVVNISRMNCSCMKV